MDKFLRIVYANQLADSEKGEMFQTHFEPLMSRLQELVSPKIFDELEELWAECAVLSSEFYAVEGMKLAIGIMDGTYIPTV